MLLVIAMVTIAAVAYYYTPPLLREGAGHRTAKALDFLGFAWHHNRAFWYEAIGSQERANCVFLLSAWYRPAFLEKYVRDPSNMDQVSAEFEGCRHYRIAALIFEKTLSRGDPAPEDRARLGRLYLEAEVYDRAIRALEISVQEEANPDTMEDLARANEKSGQFQQALYWCHEALALQDSRFRSLASLERLGTASEKELARSRLQELATKQLQSKDVLSHSGGRRASGAWAFWRNDVLTAQANLLAGPVIVRVVARGSFAGDDWPIMAVTLESQEIGRVRVAADSYRDYDFPLNIPEPDRYSLEIRFLNDFFDRDTKKDRNLFVKLVMFIYS